jgi:hypothetical protein
MRNEVVHFEALTKAGQFVWAFGRLQKWLALIASKMLRCAP